MLLPVLLLLRLLLRFLLVLLLVLHVLLQLLVPLLVLLSLLLPLRLTCVTTSVIRVPPLRLLLPLCCSFNCVCERQTRPSGSCLLPSDGRWPLLSARGGSGGVQRLLGHRRSPPNYAVVLSVPPFDLLCVMLQKEMFCAEKGRGAHLNGTPLRASGCTDIGRALTCISFGVSTLRQVPCCYCC